MLHGKNPTDITLYDFAYSGHCHRVRLLLSILALPHQVVALDMRNGEHKQTPHLARNALGQVPVLTDGELTISDSNAILVYLATRYGDESWLPRSPIGAARVQRWLSLAAGELAFGPAAARAKALFGRPTDETRAQALSASLFGLMESELGHHAFLAGDTPTIADLSCYAYVARAPEGGLALEPYAHVRSWLGRVEALPGFLPMPKAEV